MFTLDQDDSYTWPIKVSLAANGGRFIEQTFDAIFKRNTQTKIKEMLNAEEASDFSFAQDVLVGWKGINDKSGADIPFSEGARDKLLDVPAVANAIVQAYIDSSLNKGAKRKNS